MKNPLLNIEEPLEFLSALIAIPSVNPNLSSQQYSEQHIILSLREWAECLGLQTTTQRVEEGRENLIVTRIGQNPKKSIIFESHVDTVSVTQMTIDPFEPVQKEGKLFGRGACDTKASVAAMGWMMRNFALRDVPPPVTLHWVATVDEEYSMKGAVELANWINQRRAEGEEVLGVLIGEPTVLRPVIAHKGALHFPVTVLGEPAHGSTPHLGKNAVVTMSDAIQKLTREYIPGLEEISHPLTGVATLNIGRIEGGTQANIVPAECRMLLDRRTVPGESNEEVLRELYALMKSVESAGSAKFDFSEAHNSCEPVSTNPDALLVKALQASLQFHGLDSVLTGVPYATDASRLTECEVPLIVFGPGDIAQAHTKDEYVEMAQLEKAIGVLEKIPESFLS